MLGNADKHEYASDVLDAGALARFGRVEVEQSSAAFEIFTRSGNVEQPIRGWSDWQPLRNGVTASPAGRFFQWKAVLSAGGNVGSVGVNYLPVNAAPVIDDLVVATGARSESAESNRQPARHRQHRLRLSQPHRQIRPAPIRPTPRRPLRAQGFALAVTIRWAAHD